MKRALIEKDTNKVVQVVNLGEEFDVHPGGLYWEDCPDDTQTFFELLEDGTYKDPHADSRDEFGNPVEPWIMQRARAYAPSGDQLDMLYRELKETGTISQDGEWFQHITAVKEALPKPDAYTPPQ
jgi:hypothetical protein